MKNPKLSTGSKVVFVGAICGLATLSASAYKPDRVYFVDLSDGAAVSANPIQTAPFKPVNVRSDAAVITVQLDEVIHSKLSGIGGAFNEQGGEAFMRLPQAEQKKLAEALFNPATGSGLSMCRTAVGSSDFGLGAYSYSETPEDYKQKHFSVERDIKSVIPFIQAGFQQNPDLKIFASPWSPPGWMKDTGKMDDGAVKKQVGKRKVWVNNGKNYLRSDPGIKEAYALYFTKYIQAYAQHGVSIERLAIQNETDMNTIYPSCDVSPELMATLAFDFIKPAFKQAGLETEVWAGTFRGKRNDAAKFIALEGASEIDGIAMQYAQPKQVEEICKKDFAAMHTEGKCENGKNSIEQARSRFGEIANWLNAGTENYCYWNIVLNETSTSGWGWKQNSLIKIDRDAGKVIYNSDYLPVTLLSRFIRPGDQSLMVSVPDGISAIAVRNSERLVVFLQNDTEEPVQRTISIAEKKVTVELSARQLCAFVFKK